MYFIACFNIILFSFNHVLPQWMGGGLYLCNSDEIGVLCLIIAANISLGLY